jgi:hypothetical protein
MSDETIKHVWHTGRMTRDEVRKALGLDDSYEPKHDGKSFDGLVYDYMIHNRIKSWFKGINLCDREQVMDAWVRAHNFDLWHMRR